MDLQIDELRQRLTKHGVGIEVAPQAKQYLLDHGYDPKNGVRPMRRLIQDTIEDHLAMQLLENNYHKGDILQVSSKKNDLTYKVSSETVEATASAA